MASLFGIQKKLGILSQQPERIEMERFKPLQIGWGVIWGMSKIAFSFGLFPYLGWDLQSFHFINSVTSDSGTIRCLETVPLSK